MFIRQMHPSCIPSLRNLHLESKIPLGTGTLENSLLAILNATISNEKLSGLEANQYIDPPTKIPAACSLCKKSDATDPTSFHCFVLSV